MLVTEHEAREKICPDSFHKGEADTCCASECMAWRKYTIVKYPSLSMGVMGGTPTVPEYIPTKYGYCGKAGNVSPNPYELGK